MYKYLGDRFTDTRLRGAKKCCIEILEGIIANKKIIEADYSIDEDYLNQLKKLEV